MKQTLQRIGYQANSLKLSMRPPVGAWVGLFTGLSLANTIGAVFMFRVSGGLIGVCQWLLAVVAGDTVLNVSL